MRFEEYDIGYVCMQYIRIEEYDTSMGMNDDERMFVHGRGQTNKIGRMDVCGQMGPEEQNRTNRCRTEL
jgi:hypothetical protein